MSEIVSEKQKLQDSFMKFVTFFKQSRKYKEEIRQLEDLVISLNSKFRAVLAALQS